MRVVSKSQACYTGTHNSQDTMIQHLVGMPIPSAWLGSSLVAEMLGRCKLLAHRFS
jgi:hypothetical protein